MSQFSTYFSFWFTETLSSTDKENVENHNDQNQNLNNLDALNSANEFQPACDKEIELSIEKESDTVAALDVEILEKLGEDPTSCSPEDTDFHPDLSRRWKVWLVSGIPKDVKVALLDKYSRKGPCQLEAPGLNPEVGATLSEPAKKRDQHFADSQNSIGSALSALGSSISILISENEEEIDKLDLIEKLCDAGKLLTDLFHAESNARRAFISPTLNPQIKTIIDKSTADEWLYGSDLGEKIKAAKSIEKISNDLKSQAPAKKTTPKPTSLNWKSPLARQKQVGDRSKSNWNPRFTPKFKQNYKTQQRPVQNKDQVQGQPSNNRYFYQKK